MKSLIKKVVPVKVIKRYRKIKMQLVVGKDFLYDYNKFIKVSAFNEVDSKEKMASFLIKEYHAIEKGLALKSPKIAFGSERIINLMNMLDAYVNQFGKDYVTDISIACLDEYSKFDDANNPNHNPVNDRIKAAVKAYNVVLEYDNIGGTKPVKKEDILSTLQFDFNAFFRSRFSTRDFTTEPVARELVTSAIDLAKYTPSVCNRQAWRVYLIDQAHKELLAKFLTVQNGNKGFGDQISTLLIITGKLSSFFAYERNQVFVDGGMFAMSIVLALHSKGLGVCCLNTSYTAEQNEAFKKIIKLDEDSVPIMFLGIGNLKDNYKVAVSERKPLDEILKVL